MIQIMKHIYKTSFSSSSFMLGKASNRDEPGNGGGAGGLEGNGE